MDIKKDIITSKSNPGVTLAASLSEKKYRDRYGLFKTDGFKLAEELLSKGIVPETVYISERSIEKAKKLNCETAATVLSDSLFERFSEEKSPEGIICIVKHLDNLRKIVTIDNSGVCPGGWEHGRIMLLESIRDPGNLGTVIRSAAALSVDRLIISEDCADVYNGKTVRATMGALFGMKIDRVDSLENAVVLLKNQGRRVFAAALDRTAVGLDEMKLESGDCFIIGNEGHGLSSEVLEASTSRVFIPMETGSESLNAAAAAAIILWEQKRQAAK